MLVVPFQSGIPDPPGMSAALVEQKQKDRKFLEQLLDGTKLESYTIPVPIKAELRKYQQVSRESINLFVVNVLVHTYIHLHTRTHALARTHTCTHAHAHVRTHTQNVDVTSLYFPQDGVNWLAFLNRYKLHGILCDGILYFVFDAFLRFIYVRQYITFLCPCSVQSFGALVLSVSVQMQRHPEFSVNYYERASYRILS